MSRTDGRASRGRFEAYKARKPAGLDEGQPQDEGRGAGRHRSIGRLYRELYRSLRGHRGSIALALLTLSVGTSLKLVPPAATKLVIDHVLLGKALPPDLPAWLPVPESARGKLFALVGTVFAVSVVGTAIGLWGRWLATPGEQAGPGRDPAEGLRSRRQAAASTGSTSSRPGAPRACSARTPAASAS